MRGYQKNFSSLFQPSVTTNPANKGKKSIFKDERDEALATRYYFYVQIKRLRYDDCLDNLSKDFFLAPSSIHQLIPLKYDFIKQLIADKTTVKQLSKKYPNFSWD
jgi:hypothetical protein